MMTNHREKRLIPYEPEQIFDLVADVESYSTFLPLWEKAKVYERQGDTYYTDQVIQLGLARKSFRSKTVLHRPTHIDVSASEGLCPNLAIRWDFEPMPDGTCCVNCSMECDAPSPLLQIFFNAVLSQASRSIVIAFEERAHELYG